MPNILDQDLLAWRFRQISCAPHGILLVLKIEPRGYGDAIDPLFGKIPCRVHSFLAWAAPPSRPRSDELHSDGFQATLRSVHEKATHKETHHAHPIKTSRYDRAGSWLLGDATKLGALDPAL